jgi:hypothetical protein
METQTTGMQRLQSSRPGTPDLRIEEDTCPLGIPKPLLDHMMFNESVFYLLLIGLSLLPIHAFLKIQRKKSAGP